MPSNLSYSKCQRATIWLLCLLAIQLQLPELAIAAEKKVPLEVPRLGLSLHLESNTGVQQSNGRIDEWQSISGLPSTLGVVGNPEVLANTLNDHAVIQLTSADALYYTSITELADQFNDRTMVVLLSQSNLAVRIGYDHADCAAFFGFSWDANGEGTTKPSCKPQNFANAPATASIPAASWQLHTSVLQGGTVFHLHNGRLIDGSQRLAATNQGIFSVEPQAPSLRGSSAQTRYLRIAALLVYDRALAVAEINALHSYLGNKYFDNPSIFTAVKALDADNFPPPQISLWANSSDEQSLELGWKARFADECAADTLWTTMRSTEGEASIQGPSTGSVYGLNCWHAGGSSAATVTFGAKSVVISWSEPESVAAGTLLLDNLIYQLLVGRSPGVYEQKYEIDAAQHTSFALNLLPGTYFVAMKTLSAAGDASPLSPELAFRVN